MVCSGISIPISSDKNVMDKDPFFEWNVLNDAIPCELLTILQRAEFDSKRVKDFAGQRTGKASSSPKLIAVLRRSAPSLSNSRSKTLRLAT